MANVFDFDNVVSKFDLQEFWTNTPGKYMNLSILSYTKLHRQNKHL